MITVNAFGKNIQFPDGTPPEEIEKHLKNSEHIINPTLANKAKRFGQEFAQNSLGINMGIDTSDQPKDTDYLKGFAAGANKLVSGVGYLTELAGAKDTGKAIRGFGDRGAAYWNNLMSEGGKQAAASQVFEDDEDSLTGLRLSDSWGNALLMGAAQSAPSMFAAAVPGALTASAIQKLASLGLAGGAGATIPLLAGTAAPVGVASNVIARAPAAVGFGAWEGITAGAMNAADFKSSIEEMSLEEKRKSPVFAALEQQYGVDEATARLAEQAAIDVFGRTAVSTGTIGALTGGGALGQAYQKATGAAKGGLLNQSFKGAGQEALQETPQSGMEKLIENVATRDYLNPDQNIMEGVMAEAASGGAIGGLMGGVVGAGGAVNINKTAQDRAARINQEREKLGLTKIASAQSVDEAIQAATETVSQKPVTGQDIFDTEAGRDTLLAKINQAPQNIIQNTPESATTVPDQVLTQPGTDLIQPQATPIDTGAGATVDTQETGSKRNTEIVLPDGTGLPAQWEVVDADTVTASLREGKNQPRDRTRAAANAQVSQIAQDPDYRRLGASPVMDAGAPTLDSTGAIVGGNGRFEGVSQSYDSGSSAKYRAALEVDAANKGIDPASFAGMKKPVLVRRITQPFDTRKLAIASNSGTSLEYSALERAKIDAGRITDLDQIDVTDSGDVAITSNNIPNIRTALKDYSTSELGSFLGGDGNLSQEGARRLKNAILYAAYGDSPTLSRMVESTDTDLRNIVGALTKAAAQVAGVRSDAKAGGIPKQLDITDNVIQAVEKIGQIKAKGDTVENYLTQGELFSDIALAPETKEIMAKLSGFMRSQKKMTEYIRALYKAVGKVDVTTGSVFGQQDIPTKMDIVSGVGKQFEETPASGPGSLFAVEDVPGEPTSLFDTKPEPKKPEATVKGVEVKPETVEPKKQDTQATKPKKTEAKKDDVKYSRPPEERIKDRERSNRLQRLLRASGHEFTITPADMRDVTDLGSGTQAEASTAEQIARVFRKRITWIKADGPFRINGVIIPSIGDTIFIDVRTEKVVHAVMGHELSHHMEHDATTAYNDMVSALETIIQNDKGYRDKYQLPTEETDANVVREIVGDIMGDNFTQPEFWDKVAAYNPNAFRKIADAIVSWIKKLVNNAKIRGLGSEQWVTDAKKAQDIVAKAVAQYTYTESSFDGLKNKAMFQTAWHGSPHDHDQFSTDKIGTGEGAQAYGYGLYFTDTKEVAEWYRRKLTNSMVTVVKYKGVEVEGTKLHKLPSEVYEVLNMVTGATPGLFFKDPEVIRKAIRDSISFKYEYYNNGPSYNTNALGFAENSLAVEVKRGAPKSRISKIKTKVNKLKAEILDNKERAKLFLDIKDSDFEIYKKNEGNEGRLYQVELAPKEDEYLLWDKPLNKQSERVKQAITGSLGAKGIYPEKSQEYSALTGRGIYRLFSEKWGADKAKASNYLHSLGIRGVKYLDGSSRRKGKGSYNYVIFDEKDVSIKAKFSFAGQKSETADQHQLTTAQTRLEKGDNPETVRKETGWFKGVDGQWRYEISDMDAKIKKPFPEKGQLWVDIYDAAYPVSIKEKGRGVTVGDILDHPALFAAYPAIADISVSKQKGGGASFVQQTAVSPPEIKIGAATVMNDVKSILLHEIQHGIQRVEGFATGGSAGRIAADPISYLSTSRLEYATTLPAYQQLRTDEDREAFLEKFARNELGSPYDAYTKLAGEIEARNVQKRMKYDAQTRKEVSPELSADFPSDEAIIVYNGKVMNSAPPPENYDYRGEHTAPSRDGGAPLHDLTGKGEIYPDDVYSSKAVQYYGTGDKYDKVVFEKAKLLRGKPDAIVEIYRAVPKDAPDEINPGDWVAVNKNYAKEHGASYLADFKVISKKVKASEVFTNGDSIQEWGYDPGDSKPESKFSHAERPANEFNNVKDLSNHLEELGVSNFISEKDGVITVSKIVVPKGARSQGTGTAAMTQLAAYADATNQRIVLTPSSDFGGSKSRLVTFYKRFGFVENKGRNKDYATTESMYRDPQKGGPKFSRTDTLAQAGVDTTERAKDSGLPEETKMQAFRRRSQDAMLRFKVLQNWLKEQGVELTEAANVYQRENISKGKQANQIEDFRRDELEPLIKQIAETSKKAPREGKFNLGDVATYLEAVHIPEANERMRLIRKNDKATANGITDEQAKAVVKQFEDMPNFAEFKKLAEQVRQLGSDTLEMRLDAGLTSREQYDAYKGAYKQWVPLRGNMTEQAFGKGMSTSVKDKRRMGHSFREEEFVIENLVQDRERAIMQIEKNKVGMAVGTFILEAKNENIGTVGKPEPMRTMKDFAYAVEFKGRALGSFETESAAKNMVSKMLSKRGELIPEGESFTEADFNVKKTYDPHIVMSARPQLADNEIQVYVNGNAIRIQLNDPLLARAATNAGIEQVGALVYGARQFNRFLSKAYTAWSPDFLFMNMARDAYSGTLVLTGKKGAAFTAKVFGNYVGAVKELVKGRNDPKRSKWVPRYRKAGGNIGAAYLSDLERVGEDAVAALQEFAGARETYRMVYNEQISKGSSEKKARTMAMLKAGVAKTKAAPVVGHLFKTIERVNMIIENALRLATFKTAIEMGESDPQAAMLSKDLMNFNRKGEVANTMGAAYLFYNPGMQGAHIVGEALFTSPHKKQVWGLLGGFTALSFILAELIRGGDDDDDERKWQNVPEHVKDRSIIIPVGDKQITIPVAYGFGIFHAMGNYLSDMNHGADINETAIKLSSAMFENFSVFGNPILDKEGEVEYRIDQLLPTLLKLGMSPGINLDSLGRPIQPTKSQWSDSVPDSQNMFRSVRGTFYEDMAHAMNDITGGSKYEPGAIDISPNTIKYWVTSLTGGAGRFVSDITTGAMGATEGLPPELENTPVIRKFIREPGVVDSRAAFYKAKKEADTAAQRFNKALKDGDVFQSQKMLDENQEIIALTRFAAASAKMAGAARDEVLNIQVDEGMSKAEKRLRIREIEAGEQRVYDSFLEYFDAAKRTAKK